MAGQIIGRGEKTWLVRVFEGRDLQTGRRQYHNHTVHGTKDDAQKYLNGKLRERDLGIYAGVKHVTMGLLFDDVLTDYQINDQDYDWAERVLRKHLRPQFGALKASKVTNDQITKYVEMRRNKGHANATINRALALLRRAFNLGKQSGKVGFVPHIPMLKENNVRKGFFEHDQFVAVRAALPEEIRPIITLAYYTGCRKGEILTLRWSQVDLSEYVIRLEPGETKNDEARTLPLAPELYEMLKMQKEIRDQHWPESPWVFSRCGERVKNFRKVWETACKAVGLSVQEDGKDKLTRLFHDLRRTGVRNLSRARVPEVVTMRISGHKTRSVFDRYNIVNEQDLKDAARSLGEYLAHKGTPSESRHTMGTQEPVTAVH